MPDEKNLDELLQRSAQTDIQVLLSAKESAKRATLSDPSSANLAAMERASKLLEARMDAAKSFKNAREVICAERLLRSEGVAVEIIPVPEKYSSECGMCIRIQS